MTSTHRIELDGTPDGYGGMHYYAPAGACLQRFEVFRGRVFADIIYGTFIPRKPENRTPPPSNRGCANPIPSENQ